MARGSVTGGRRSGGTSGGGSTGGGGPQFTDYAKRRVTNDLTKAEKQAEHKWRMKNDLDYKNEIAIKKAKAKPMAKKAVPKLTATKKPAPKKK
jgi:hypothetical protein